MKVIICGCNGLLGQKLVAAAPSDVEVLGIDLHEKARGDSRQLYQKLDISERRSLTKLVRHFRPDWVLNAAAYTDVDGAETERALCWRVNVTAVENLVYACRKVHAKIVHVSTDYIFDGTNGPYREEDFPNPIGYYGRSKLAGENVLKAGDVEFAIARTMVLYGKAEGVRANFVTWLIAKLQAGEHVRIVTDQFGNTTLAEELAAGLWAIVEKSKAGVFHIAGREIIDRYHFALKIAHVFGLNADLIHPITTAELAQAAPRPMRSGLVVDKALKELGIELSDVEGGLRKFKQQFVLDASGSPS